MELRVRVVYGMQMILIRDFCKVVGPCAVFLHMLDPSIAEHLSGDGTLGKACTIDDYDINKSNTSNIVSILCLRTLQFTCDIRHELDVLIHGICTIHIFGRQRAALHLLESKRQNAFRVAALDDLLAEVESSGTGGAIVVNVVNGTSVESDLVDRPLTAGRVAVHVSNADGLHVLVGYTRVLQGLGHRLLRHLRIIEVLPAAGFLESRHPDADHVHSWPVNHPGDLFSNTSETLKNFRRVNADVGERERFLCETSSRAGRGGCESREKRSDGKK